MPPVKNYAGSTKKGFLQKGFLNPRLAAIAPTASREAKDVGVLGLHSPSGCCIIPSSIEDNSCSQSQEWPVWEKENDFWDGLPLD